MPRLLRRVSSRARPWSSLAVRLDEWQWVQAPLFMAVGAGLAVAGWAILNVADMWRARRYAAGKPPLKRAGLLIVLLTAVLAVIGIALIVVVVSLS